MDTTTNNADTTSAKTYTVSVTFRDDQVADKAELQLILHGCTLVAVNDNCFSFVDTKGTTHFTPFYNIYSFSVTEE